VQQGTAHHSKRKEPPLGRLSGQITTVRTMAGASGRPAVTEPTTMVTGCCWQLWRSGASTPNDEVEAMYPTAYVDSQGDKLDASKYHYAL
jgi:hypothetical protein